ncbi:putative transporter, partial [Pseudoloma neurophilia]
MPHSNKIRILKALLHDKKYSNLQSKLDKFNQNFQDIKQALTILNKESSGNKNIIQIVKDEYGLSSEDEIFYGEKNYNYENYDNGDKNLNYENYDNNHKNPDNNHKNLNDNQNLNDNNPLQKVSDSPSTSHYFKSLKKAVYTSPFDFGLSIKTKSGIVAFKHQRSASVLCQALISSKLFSIKAQPAPSPTDISYDNLNISPTILTIRKIISMLLFIIFTLTFFYLVGSLAVFLSIDFLESKIPYLAKFLNDNQNYRSSLSGILTPLTYNILMVISPFFIQYVVSFEFNISKTQDQMSLIRKFSLFLIFNGFLAFIVGTSLYQVSGLKDITSIIEELQDGLINSSVFFTNVLIQRTLFGQILLLFSIGSIFGKLFSYFTKKNTLRQKRKIYSSENLDFGTSYPNFMLVFAICLTYSLLTPIILIIGLIFFFFTLLIYKTKFIYNISNKTECGGIHFNFATNYIFHILLFFQFVNFANQFKESIFLGICTFILFVLTWLFKDSLLKSFDRATTYYPLSLQEELYIDSFTRSLLHSRIKFLKDWYSEDDKDIVFLDEIGLNTVQQALEDHDEKNERLYENVLDREGIYLDINVYQEFDR